MKHISKKCTFKYKQPSVKIDAIHYIVKLTNAAVIGLSETELDNTVLSSKLETEQCDLVISDRSRREGVVACFVKKLYFIELETQFLHQYREYFYTDFST